MKEDSLVMFDFWKHGKQCMKLLHDQWTLGRVREDGTEYNTYLFSWLYLFEILRRSYRQFVTYAPNTEDVIGFIGYSDKLKPAYRYQILYWILICYLSVRYRNNYIKMYHEWNRHVDEIQKFDGELSIFIVHPKYRRCGLGRMMFGAMCADARSNGLRNFLIYTYEESCTVAFYKNHPNIRRYRDFYDKESDNQVVHLFIYLCDLYHQKDTIDTHTRANYYKDLE